MKKNNEKKVLSAGFDLLLLIVLIIVLFSTNNMIIRQVVGWSLIILLTFIFSNGIAGYYLRTGNASIFDRRDTKNKGGNDSENI